MLTLVIFRAVHPPRLGGGSTALNVSQAQAQVDITTMGTRLRKSGEGLLEEGVDTGQAKTANSLLIVAPQSFNNFSQMKIPNTVTKNIHIYFKFFFFTHT